MPAQGTTVQYTTLLHAVAVCFFDIPGPAFLSVGEAYHVVFVAETDKSNQPKPKRCLDTIVINYSKDERNPFLLETVPLVSNKKRDIMLLFCVCVCLCSMIPDNKE